jgi:hypothetical protein
MTARDLARRAVVNVSTVNLIEGADGLPSTTRAVGFPKGSSSRLEPFAFGRAGVVFWPGKPAAIVLSDGGSH